VQNFSHIGGRVTAIKLIGFGRRPLSWIFEENVFGPFHTLWDPILYAHTKFGKDILMGKEDMHQKRI